MSMSVLMKRRILITGSPGVGKTTAIKKVCNILKDQHQMTLHGFYTEEIRNGKVREGFDVVAFDGERGSLARKNDLVSSAVKRNSPSVGQYVVDVQSFENVAIKNLEEENASLLIIDEIGKMELISAAFSQNISRIFGETELSVIATIPLPSNRPLKLVDQIRSREDVVIISVTKENRDGIVDEILKELLKTN